MLEAYVGDSERQRGLQRTVLVFLLLSFDRAPTKNRPADPSWASFQPRSGLESTMPIISLAFKKVCTYVVIWRARNVNKKKSRYRLMRQVQTTKSWNHSEIPILVECRPRTVKQRSKGMSSSHLSITQRYQALRIPTSRFAISITKLGIPRTPTLGSVRILKAGHLAAGQTEDKCPRSTRQCSFRTRNRMCSVFLDHSIDYRRGQTSFIAVLQNA